MKVIATIVVILGVAMLGLFTTYAFALTKTPPVSAGIPTVGQKAPRLHSAGQERPTRRALELLESSNGVLLIFYRGYW